ncbi:MAG: flagellar basal body-associated FliL family protein [Micavibrio aeruginosavorus]|nr:flagellar basal body-associated FliL family protein [Micavibrio aeruginosavorus]
MKIVVIALVALLLLGGGGAGAYFYFKQPAEAASGAAGEHAEGAKAKSKGGHAGTSAFVQLDPLLLPIIGKNGVTQSVSMVIVIETPDEASKAMVVSLAPRLKDAFIQDMYGVLSQETMVRGGVIQVTALKNRLHKVSNKVLGEGMAKDVLLQVVQQKPM